MFAHIRKCGIVAGRRKLYLTAIGGGVFRNRKAWIVAALEAQAALIAAAQLDVRLVLFDRRELPPDSADYRRLAALVVRLGGVVQEIRWTLSLNLKRFEFFCKFPTFFFLPARFSPLQFKWLVLCGVVWRWLC